MPSGFYIRTEDHRKILSEARKKWIKENPKLSQKFYNNSSEVLKNTWKDNRKGMLKNCQKGGIAANGIALKKEWESNRERMLGICSEAGKIGGKIGGRIGGKIVGKITGGRAFKNAWENDYEGIKRKIIKGQNKYRKENPTRVHEIAVKAGKIGGGIGGRNAWKNDRKRMLDGCSKGGKASIQKQLKVKPSYIELIVRSYLDRKRIGHQDNVWFKSNEIRREADIIVPKYKLIIECDGFMHNSLKIKENDRYKTRFFNKLGYRVLRLKSSEIRDGTFKAKISKEMGND